MPDAHVKSVLVIYDSTCKVGCNDVENDDANDEQGYLLPLPSVSEIRKDFEELKGIAYDWNVSDAIHFLWKAKEVLVKAKQSSFSGCSRQKLFTEMFK